MAKATKNSGPSITPGSSTEQKKKKKKQVSQKLPQKALASIAAAKETSMAARVAKRDGLFQMRKQQT